MLEYTDPNSEDLKPNINRLSLIRKAKAVLVAGALALGLGGMIHSDTEPNPSVALMHPGSPRFDGKSVLVMTANVHGWKNEDDKGNNLDKFVEVMGETGADVACMQEVFIDDNQLEELWDNGYNVAFAETRYDFYRGQFGNAVISPYKFELEHVIGLPSIEDGTPRNAMLLNLPTTSGSFSFVNTHLSYDDSQEVETKYLLNHTRTFQPDFLCGDLNQPSGSLLAMGYGKSFSPASFAKQPDTYPNDNPSAGIDFVLERCVPGGENKSRTVEVGSDHLAVLSQVAINGCRN